MRWASGLWATCGALAAATTLVTTSAAAQIVSDSDGDGLPDEWERSGHGILDPRIHGVSVGKRDFIIVYALRGNTDAAAARAAMERVRTFYAGLPIPNPDGSTGLNLVLVEGPRLAAEYNDPDRSTYDAMYGAGFPVAWRGIGRGFLVEARGGRGGQTIPGGEWAAAGAPWQTIAHEIGHQLGIDGHAPPGSGVSPLYGSIMSYDYNYSFNGNADAVHMSTGRFAGVTLDETRLDEVLPFALGDVAFLQAAPYKFKLQADGPSRVLVDWNRNGIPGERGIQADINDGYAVSGSLPALELGPTSGAPVLAPVGRHLFLVYPQATTPQASWTNAFNVNAHGASIMVSRIGSDGPTSPVDGRGSATSELSAVGFGNNTLAVGYQTAGIARIVYWPVRAEGGLGDRKEILWPKTMQTAVSSDPFKPDRVLLVVGTEPAPPPPKAPSPIPGTNPGQPTPQVPPSSANERPALFMLLWSAAAQEVHVVRVAYDGLNFTFPPQYSYPLRTGNIDRLKCSSPPAATIDPANNSLIVACRNDAWNRGVVRTHHFAYRNGGYAELSFMLDVGDFGSDEAPTLVLDPPFPGERRSRMTVYGKVAAPGNVAAIVRRAREVRDGSGVGGWRTSMMSNEWEKTQSAPAAASFDGSHAYAVRFSHQDARIPDRIVLYRRTGIVPGPLRDFDDLPLLRMAMKTRLEALRAYHRVK
ncbi:MAG: hypothetical protein HOO96_30360 [Polyangiaceae bacterium]|nr:hypothetical protein [Polyangiaceae bacterium]